jgi:hypothetical protein
LCQFSSGCKNKESQRVGVETVKINKVLLYSNLEDFENNILSVLESIYYCKQTFSLTKLNKSVLRMQMTGEYLAAILNTATVG